MWQEEIDMPVNLFEISPLMIRVPMPLPLLSSLLCTGGSTAALGFGSKDSECLEVIKDPSTSKRRFCISLLRA